MLNYSLLWRIFPLNAFLSGPDMLITWGEFREIRNTWYTQTSNLEWMGIALYCKRTPEVRNLHLLILTTEFRLFLSSNNNHIKHLFLVNDPFASQKNQHNISYISSCFILLKNIFTIFNTFFNFGINCFSTHLAETLHNWRIWDYFSLRIQLQKVLILENDLL